VEVERYRGCDGGSSSPCASAALLAAAARTPATMIVGYSVVTFSAVIPTARQSKIMLTGTRVPAITAWPCITFGSVEMIAAGRRSQFLQCASREENATPAPGRASPAPERGRHVIWARI